MVRPRTGRDGRDGRDGRAVADVQNGQTIWHSWRMILVSVLMVCVTLSQVNRALTGRNLGDRLEMLKTGAADRAMDDATREHYRLAAKEMFYHAYDSYLLHAFPKDELAPMSCSGHDTHNCHGCLLTFFDALDTLVVLDNRTEFQRVVNWLAANGAAAFDRDQTVSVFETNIRVLGSLISNHMLAKNKDLRLMPEYNDELLALALDVGNRLLRAYQTPTGLPWGSISLKTGPKFGETPVTATATGGTVLLEFLLLSQLSGEKKFAKAAERATKALWDRRSDLGLLGSHINIETGEWVYFDSGIGGGIDSFYEYLFKAHLLTGKQSCYVCLGACKQTCVLCDCVCVCVCVFVRV
jgi:mannosidase alpha-like ER degradation enhancer 2